MADSALDTLQKYLRRLDCTLKLRDKTSAISCGLTLPQHAIICEIGSAGELIVKNLSKSLGLDKSTISRSLDGLVRAGFVLRTPSSDDRRSVVVTLDLKGQKVYERITADWATLSAGLLKNIPAGKQGRLIESLALLMNGLAPKTDGVKAANLNRAPLSRRANEEAGPRLKIIAPAPDAHFEL
ncbi:MAG: MarR family transcriptional regulator [Chitinivibrionales bacterium]|nr:MarR family transcriptional regulator [Chitinivibrionales bacterium]